MREVVLRARFGLDSRRDTGVHRHPYPKNRHRAVAPGPRAPAKEKPAPFKSHSYGLNGFGMCKGAQHKVYSTMYNILAPVSLIQYTRVGTDSSGHLRPHEASAVSRSPAIATAATPLPLSYMCVRISARTQTQSRQAC